MTNRIKNITPYIIVEYIKNNLTTHEISIKFNINVKTVLKVLKLNNIIIRGGKINLIGNHYGRLKVVKFTKLDNNQKTMWECSCICGKTTEVRGADLISEKVQSCGCLHAESSKKNIKIAHNKYPKSFGFKGIGDLQGKYLSSVKYNAMKRKLEYNVTKEYLWDLYNKQNCRCALTGLEISLKTKNNLQTASIDRIDSSKGYVCGNVQWVHKDINNIKQSYSIETLIFYANLLIETYSAKKNI